MADTAARSIILLHFSLAARVGGGLIDGKNGVLLWEKKLSPASGPSIPVRLPRVIYTHGGYYYYHHHRRRCRRHRYYAMYVYRSEWLGIKQLTGPSHDDEAVRIGVFCTCVYIYIYNFFFFYVLSSLGPPLSHPIRSFFFRPHTRARVGDRQNIRRLLLITPFVRVPTRRR